MYLGTLEPWRVPEKEGIENIGGNVASAWSCSCRLKKLGRAMETRSVRQEKEIYEEG
jgi:hypothetical protein